MDDPAKRAFPVPEVQWWFSRDSAYLIAGGIMISAVLRATGQCALLGDLPTPLWLFLAGLAYVTGLATQDGSSLTGLVTVQMLTNPSGVDTFLFGRFERRSWPPIELSDAIRGFDLVQRVGSVGIRAEFYRIRFLLVVCAATGSSSFIAGLVLVLLSRIKAMQLAQFCVRNLPALESEQNT